MQIFCGWSFWESHSRRGEWKQMFGIKNMQQLTEVWFLGPNISVTKSKATYFVAA